VTTFAARLEDVFGIDGERAVDFADWILEASARQQLPPELIAGLIYTESSFRKRVRSWAGAVGPAQVKPRFWREFCGGADLSDPEHNVHCGAQVLAHYMQQCGEFDCALRLYNVGPRNLRDPYYHKRSGHYLAKVEGHRSRLEGVAGL
jgi:soluble lytic murein transglycosylase-like protein